MAHRNRCFTVLKNGGSFPRELLNHQRVSYIFPYISQLGGFAAAIEVDFASFGTTKPTVSSMISRFGDVPTCHDYQGVMTFTLW